MAILAAGTGNGRALWYLTRGTGAVTLILLTLSVILGIVDQRRWRSQRWPRFVLDAMHRNVSLLVLALLAVHVLTAWLDSFAPISLLDAVVPFRSSYRPVWLGLGALGLDLLVAIAVTSLLRQRVGQPAWRAIHWLAYAAWPVAVVHGLGTGTDTPSTWMLALTVACILAVLAASLSRAASGWPAQRSVRTTAFAALAIGPLALAIWLPRGPLGSSWARRAGTPASLLSSGRHAQASVASSRSPAPTARRSSSRSFTAGFSGAVRQGSAPNGDAVVDLDLALSGPGSRRLHIRIEGPAAAGGGVSLASSQVDLGTASAPNAYQGSIRALRGDRMAALVSGPGGPVALRIAYGLDSSGTRISGTVEATPGGGGRP